MNIERCSAMRSGEGANKSRGAGAGYADKHPNVIDTNDQVRCTTRWAWSSIAVWMPALGQ
jgi:hypothetical protein